jgi:hypothetical protein
MWRHPTAVRRFYVTPPGAATTERVRPRLAEIEYRIVSHLASASSSRAA